MIRISHISIDIKYINDMFKPITYQDEEAKEAYAQTKFPGNYKGEYILSPPLQIG